MQAYSATINLFLLYHEDNIQHHFTTLSSLFSGRVTHDNNELRELNDALDTEEHVVTH